MPSNVQPPRGMRDFLPADKARRDGVLAEIRDSFATFGYREIETPVAEELSRLESGQGGDNEKLIFRIQKRGLDPAVPVAPAEAADLGLRYDLTVPLARFYATHRAELPTVFRAIQIAPVWRAERPQRGRYRQFTQCDIDVLGEPGPLAEVELIVATVAALRRLGIGGAAVRINDRAVLAALLDACGFAAGDHPSTLVTVDKLDKVGLDGVEAELRAHGASRDAVAQLVGVLGGLAAAGEGFDATLAALPAPASAAAHRLRVIRDGVAEADPDLTLRADPSLVRGMGYYTGPIFELQHPSFSGSVGGGGRYDGMIGRFAGVDVAACGFSIGFERVVELVDAERFGRSRRQLALLHAEDVPPGRAVAWQRHLAAGGADVRLVRRTRNLGRQLGELAAEGFEQWAPLDADAPSPDGDGAALELRPLAAG